MSTGHKIRLAVPADAQALGTIQAASHQLTYRGVLPDSVLARQTSAHLIERFRLRLAVAADATSDDPRRVWVIENHDGVVGYAATEPGRGTFLPPPAGAGEMESLYLHPSAMGLGLGRTLHEHAIGDLRMRGFDPLILWAFAANQRARRFYEHAGWVPDVSGQDWVLDDIACPIVRYRRDSPSA